MIFKEHSISQTTIWAITVKTLLSHLMGRSLVENGFPMADHNPQ